MEGGIGGAHASSFRGDNGPWEAPAIKMAAAIKDVDKLIRRSLAVVKVWGTRDHPFQGKPENPWRPFKEALKRQGFSWDQISTIENFRG